MQEQTSILVDDVWVSRTDPAFEVTVIHQSDLYVTFVEHARGLAKDTLKRGEFLARYQLSKRS